MDVNTGKLRALDEDEQKYINAADKEKEELLARLNSISPKDLEGLEPVPEDLHNAAKKKLAGKKEAMVSLTSGGKLSKWAAMRRKEKKRNRNYLNNKKMRREDPNIRQIRDGVVLSHWE